MDNAESVTRVLNDDALLSIFERLRFQELVQAERVCQRWENVVRRHMASQKMCDMTSVPKSDALRVMRLCGPSLRRLVVSGKIDKDRDANLIKEIAQAFPNLESLHIDYLILEDDDLDALSTKCKGLKSVKISDCHLNDEGLGLLLANLPGLRSLTLMGSYATFQDCFDKLGPNLEHLTIGFQIKVTKAGYSLILSRSPNLKTISSGRFFDCDDSVFSSFCQGNVTLRSLAIEYSSIPSETFEHVSHCSMLEELRLFSLLHLFSDTVKKISKGCPKLKRLELDWLGSVCSRDLMSFARCKQLTTVALYRNRAITDECLLTFAEVGILKKLVVANCRKITDVGCSAVLARCRQLEELNASESPLVGNATVDAAVEEVESRGNWIALRLILIGTGVDKSKGDIDHPLLRVIIEPRPGGIFNWPTLPLPITE